MSWINFFFFVIVMNTITGTVAFFLCKLLAWIAERVGAVCIVYSMYKAVQLFYIVPLCCLYSRVRFYLSTHMYAVGDFFYGNPVILKVIGYFCLAWAAGIAAMLLYYLFQYRGFCRLRAHNVPFRNPELLRILREAYPGFPWDRVTFCTNFLLRTPCVMGVFRHELVLPETAYSDRELRAILFHEAAHIVGRDNLWKRIGLILVIVNWFNPALRWYIRDLDEWADTMCDIRVCRDFFGGHARDYFQILISTRTKGRSLIPPFVSQLNKRESLQRRLERMSKWRRNGSRKLVSAVLAAVLLAGSCVTALAAGETVTDAQNNWYMHTRHETELEAESGIQNGDIQRIPASEVDEEKWDNAVVDESGEAEPATTQKNFDWYVPAHNFGRSAGFIKSAGTQITVCCYVDSSISHHVGIRIPNGDMLYVSGKGNVVKTFPCDTTGTYYVYVENMGSTVLHASGYYLK